MKYYIYNGGPYTYIGDTKYIQELGYNDPQEYISISYKGGSYEKELIEYITSNNIELCDHLLFINNHIIIVAENDNVLNKVFNDLRTLIYTYSKIEYAKELEIFKENLSDYDYNILNKLSELIGHDIINSDLVYQLIETKHYIYFMYWDSDNTYKNGGIYDIKNDKLLFLFERERYDYTALILRNPYKYGDYMMDSKIAGFDLRNNELTVYDKDIIIENIEDVFFIKEEKDNSSKEDTYTIEKYINGKYKYVLYLGMNVPIIPYSELIGGKEYMVYQIDRPFTPGNNHAYSYNIYIDKDRYIYQYYTSQGYLVNSHDQVKKNDIFKYQGSMI